MGIAKKLLYTDGITEARVADALRQSKPKKTADLYGDSGKRLAVAFKAPTGSPLYISVGHKIDLDASEFLVLSSMVPGHPLPEPIYQVLKHVFRSNRVLTTCRRTNFRETF
jgi:deoxyinosine 3'endonuclease (endonuclease V)